MHNHNYKGVPEFASATFSLVAEISKRHREPLERWIEDFKFVGDNVAKRYVTSAQTIIVTSFTSFRCIAYSPTVSSWLFTSLRLHLWALTSVYLQSTKHQTKFNSSCKQNSLQVHQVSAEVRHIAHAHSSLKRSYFTRTRRRGLIWSILWGKCTITLVTAPR